MSPFALRRVFTLIWLGAAVLATALPVQAQTNGAPDPPDQVARINLVEGPVNVLAPSGGGSAAAQVWSDTDLNQPLTGGDRIATGRGARAELQVGATTLRLSGQTSLRLQQVSHSTTGLRLDDGSLQLRVRSLGSGQRLSVSTPNLTFTPSQPGQYRVDVNLQTGVTRVVVQLGSGLIEGERAAPLTINADQQGSFLGTHLTPAAPGAALQDVFDAWAAARDRLEDQSAAARYLPREVVGYQQLDRYGDWREDAAYGAVWIPRGIASDWAPYRAGQWRWVSPWGWTWVDDAPWGFAPFHYGRWAQIGPQWGWVPGQLPPRPVYAPALVGFIGGPGGGARAPLGWFPLAPGEAFRPAYPASTVYITQINHNVVALNFNEGERYRFQRQGSAITAAAGDDFERGRTVRGRASWLSADELARASLVGRRTDGFDSFRGAPVDTRSNTPAGGYGVRPAPAAPTPPAGVTPFTPPPTPPASVTPPAVQRPGAAAPGALVQPTPLTRGQDRVLGGPDGRAFGAQSGRPGAPAQLSERPVEQPNSRAPGSLLGADLQARQEQARLQNEQRAAHDSAVRQQELQRQRDQASAAERALRSQQEQAERTGRQQQDAQRLEFQRAQQQAQAQAQQQLQWQQQRLQTPQQEAIGQRALREQAERQQQSDERLRAQQNQRQLRDASREPAREPNARVQDKRRNGQLE